MTPSERALTQTLLWTSVGAAAAVPLLVIPPPDDPLPTLVLHLVALTVFAATLAFHLAPLADEGWFTSGSLPVRVRAALAGVVVVVLTAGAIGLVTLATSAALRYDASLQFFQLLSAGGIAWIVAALTVGLRRRFGWRPAAAGAVIVAGVCVWSVWRYLDAVGFTPAGGWVVDGDRIASLLLPAVLGAAATAAAGFALGAGGRSG